ncbi:MAG: limonene-1,2-epoxide hydrolase [Glaciecola sp.]|jgi:limonene-1,2-epoxide hydrolase|uniref:SgcJ/EcaC family oxidoreductase n=1 Tax=Congregibacter sp. TaxID=2744308 RepID=UPI0039E2A9DE
MNKVISKGFILLAAISLGASLNVASVQAEEKSPIVVAHEMVNAWNARDVDAIADLFAEDGRFLSMTQPPQAREGREVIRQEWGKLIAGLSEIELQLRNVSVSGNSVFIERLDVFTYKGKEGQVPVACVLDIRDGKVQEWREYYDKASLLSAMGVQQMDD